MESDHADAGQQLWDADSWGEGPQGHIVPRLQPLQGGLIFPPQRLFSSGAALTCRVRLVCPSSLLCAQRGWQACILSVGCWSGGIGDARRTEKGREVQVGIPGFPLNRAAAGRLPPPLIVTILPPGPWS